MTSRHQRLFFCVALILVLVNLYPPLGFSQPAKDKTHQNDSSPHIEITSDRMRSENGGQKIIFSGNVAISQDDMVITSDIIEVYSTSDKKQTDEIVAIGNVEVSRGNKKAKGDRAVYLKHLQKIILTGNPKAIAWENNDIIEGREMIFLMKKDRFVVNERVHAKLFTKKK
jgi:lipopolysaccharide transport protein LptA